MKRVQLACEHEREVAKAGEGVAAVPAWEGAPAVLEKPVVGLGAGVDCYVLVLGGAKGLERRKGEERTVSFGYGGMFVVVGLFSSPLLCVLRRARVGSSGHLPAYIVQSDPDAGVRWRL